MGYLFAPEIEADTLTAWPFQEDAVRAVRDAFAKGRRSALVLHATGTGKTVTASKIARMAAEKGNRTLILAHLSELIVQLANTVERVGIVPGVEKAGAHARACYDPTVVVASVASMQGARLASWPRDHFKLIQIDECHHGITSSYEAILKHFTGYRLVGFTATADRLDGQPIDALFGPPVHEFDFPDAMMAPAPGPYLSSYYVVRGDVGVDLRDLGKGRGDFDADDLGKRIAPLAAQFAKSIHREIGDRPTIVFVPSVLAATAFASALRKLGRDADWVSGDDPDREHKVERYKDGESQILVNAQMLMEGFDAKHTAAVALCRPTNSRANFVQMVGRGLRLHPDKDRCLVLDYDWLTDRHDLAHPADLFAKYLGSQEAVDYANEMIVRFPGVDILDIVQDARKRAGSRAGARREVDVQVRGGDVRYIRREEYDPFNGQSPPRPPKPLVAARHDAATERMVAFLKAHGHQGAAGYSKRYAGKLIGAIKARQASESMKEAI